MGTGFRVERWGLPAPLLECAPLPLGSQRLHTWGVLIMLLIMFVLPASSEFVEFSICTLSLSFL